MERTPRPKDPRKHHVSRPRLVLIDSCDFVDLDSQVSPRGSIVSTKLNQAPFRNGVVREKGWGGLAVGG